MKVTYLLAILMIFLSGCTDYYLSRGDKHSDQLEYAEAVRYYEKAAKSPEKINDPYFRQRLGHAFYELNDYDKAEEQLRMAFSEDSVSREHHVHYAEILMSKKKYQEAKSVLDEYLIDYPNDNRAVNLRLACDEITLEDNKYAYFVWPVEELNQIEYSNFSPRYYGESKLLFCTERNARNNKRNKWNNNPYLDLYIAELEDDGSVSATSPFDQKINSLYHDGPAAVFGGATGTIFFTRSDFMDDESNKLDSDHQNVNQFKLVKSEYDEETGNWSSPEQLWFNEDGVSYGHPTVSSDGNTMVFSSDKIGGKGQGDLYITEKVNGRWSTPRNLGPGINTEGNEVFPYWSDQEGGKTLLYFSSNGQQGFGGLDIYCVEKTDQGWSELRHFQGPINSSQDDFGLIISENGRSGYLSSNRASDDKSIDQIFGFTRLETNMYVKGRVIEAATGNNVPYAVVDITNSTLHTKQEILTNIEGEFMHKIAFNSNFFSTANKKGYFVKVAYFDTKVEDFKSDDTIEVVYELAEIEQGQVFVLEHIHYDFDEYRIRQDASRELDELVEFMRINNNVEIELRAHTDCRGKDRYNLHLSRKRAREAKKYLVNQGISRSRISAKGMGETQLVNDCNCKTGEYPEYNCTSQRHEENRRTEFEITSLHKPDNVKIIDQK